jgi:hypothetical protein
MKIEFNQLVKLPILCQADKIPLFIFLFPPKPILTHHFKKRRITETDIFFIKTKNSNRFGLIFELSKCMKNSPVFLFLFIAFFLFSEATLSNNNKVTMDDVFAYFREGSSKEIARYFDQTVLLNIEGRNGDYSKNQAEYILRDFFQKYPPVDFHLLHQSAVLGPSVFYVGSYKAKGQQFRVLIKGNAKSEVLRIFSIDIIKSKI